MRRLLLPLLASACTAAVLVGGYLVHRHRETEALIISVMRDSADASRASIAYRRSRLRSLLDNRLISPKQFDECMESLRWAEYSRLSEEHRGP